MNDDFEKEFYENRDNPYVLEELFHKNKSFFIHVLNKEKLKNDGLLIKAWDARVNYNNSLNFRVLLISIISAFICWIPLRILIQDSDYDYKILMYMPSIFTFIFSTFLSINKLKLKNIIIMFAVTLLTSVYLHIIPFSEDSQSIKIIYIHVPVFLWAIVGFSYCDFDVRKLQKRFDFLLLNGEILIWSTLLLLTGIILTSLTFVLFDFINVEIEDFYTKNIVSLGIVVAPFLSIPILNKFSETNISSIISKIFSPLTLITLLFYLVFSLISKEVPYENRDLLITYNAILIVVLGLIIFINANTGKYLFFLISNILLIIVSTIIDVIALSAIIYRINEYGFTPNKITILGINTLMLVNLIYVLLPMLKNINLAKTSEIIVERISKYLPVYAIWAFIVVFIIPIFFRYQ